MKKYLHLTLVLFVIATLSGLLTGYFNSVTKDVIAENNYQKTAKGIKGIFADSDLFTDLADDEESTFKADYTILNLYKVFDTNEALIGYVFKVNAPGSYSGTLEVLIGFGLDGKIKGINYVMLLETTNIGNDKKLGKQVTDTRFKNQFIGKDDLDGVDTISGASRSSSAVLRAVDLAQNYFKENIKE